ncbi:MAG: ArgR family transcriptional regulator [Pseudomonadota bacterium]
MPPDHAQQDARRTLIRNLLSEQPVRTQAELARQLKARGHRVTQSSVSRDLREMRVIKDPDGYRLPDTTMAEQLDSASDYIRSVTAAGSNLIVVHTAIGAAQRVAVELDRSEWPDVVGTISGDDTIFIATTGQPANRRVLARLQPALDR